MKALQVKHCRTRTGEPLATVDGLPGLGADLTPAQLRALADALRRIADDADARPRGRHYLPAAKTYPIEGTHAGG